MMNVKITVMKIPLWGFRGHTSIKLKKKHISRYQIEQGSFL